MSRREIDVFNLSFIDVLSCALGGILLLLLTFSSLMKANATRQNELADDLGGTTSDSALVAGEEIPPSQPLVFRIRQRGQSKYPLLVSLKVPLDNGHAVLSKAHPVTNKPFMRALFSTTRMSDREYVHTVLIPNCRLRHLDNNLAANTKWDDHYQQWEVSVRYPNHLSQELDALRTSALSASTQALNAHLQLAKPTGGVSIEGPTLQAVLTNGFFNAIDDKLATKNQWRDRRLEFIDTQGTILLLKSRTNPSQSQRQHELFEKVLIQNLANFYSRNPHGTVELLELYHELDSALDEMSLSWEDDLIPLAGVFEQKATSGELGLRHFLSLLRTFGNEFIGASPLESSGSPQVKAEIIRVPGGRKRLQSDAGTELSISEEITFRLQ